MLKKWSSKPMSCFKIGKLKGIKEIYNVAVHIYSFVISKGVNVVGSQRVWGERGGVTEKLLF